MSITSTRLFSAVLVLLGAANIFLGINAGFGGLQTLGWQGPTQFFQVTDEHLYLVRDSHARFYGGLYIAGGLFLILAASSIRRYAPALALVFAMIFGGGLARLTAMRPDIVFGPDLATSMIVELIAMPLLALWLWRITRTQTKTDSIATTHPPLTA